MKELLKSLLLFMLFGLSLVLTYQLWYGEMPAQKLEEDVYEELIVEEPRSLENLLTPQHVMVNSEEDFYIFKKGEVDYERLWGFISGALQRVNIETAIEETKPPEGSIKILAFYFMPDLPVGEELPWLSGISYAEIRSIDIYSYDARKWLVLEDSASNNLITLLLPPSKAEQLSDLMEAVSLEEEKRYAMLTAEKLAMLSAGDLETAGPIYVPVEPLTMSELPLKAEEIENEFILKTFFVDYNLARVIEEKDGGLIYTDGEKGLRLKETGLEYSAPHKEVGQVTATYPEALLNSSSLISYHGGWPEGLRLDGFSLSGWGRVAYYSARWCMFYDGFPIFTSQPTKAFFNDNGLFYYARFVFFPENVIIEQGNKKDVALWDEALAEALKLFKEQELENETVLSLEEITLGYAVVNSSGKYRGVPVWRINISGETFILDAHKLVLFEEVDLI